MKQDPRTSLKPIGGFTLIEITIALLILSISLVTFISLESSIIQRSLYDKNRTAAMLAARRILARIEADDFFVDVGEKEGAITDFLDVDEEELDPWTAKLQVKQAVEYWDIPDYPNALKRISLTVYWDESPENQLTIYYFIPNDDEAIEDRGDNDEELELDEENQ